MLRCVMVVVALRLFPAGAAEAWDRLLKVHPDHPQRQKIESLLAEVRQQRASR